VVALTQGAENEINKSEEEFMKTERVAIQEPRVARLLFSDTRFGWLWLPLRLYLGYMWFEAGWHKFVDPRWLGNGEALLDYWKRGLKMRLNRLSHTIGTVGLLST
jgi:hypothetical protein